MRPTLARLIGDDLSGLWWMVSGDQLWLRAQQRQVEHQYTPTTDFSSFWKGRTF
jgi:hypothetical protein